MKSNPDFSVIQRLAKKKRNGGVLSEEEVEQIRTVVNAVLEPVKFVKALNALFSGGQNTSAANNTVQSTDPRVRPCAIGRHIATSQNQTEASKAWSLKQTTFPNNPRRMLIGIHRKVRKVGAAGPPPVDVPTATARFVAAQLVLDLLRLLHSGGDAAAHALAAFLAMRFETQAVADAVGAFLNTTVVAPREARALGGPARSGSCLVNLLCDVAVTVHARNAALGTQLLVLVARLGRVTLADRLLYAAVFSADLPPSICTQTIAAFHRAEQGRGAERRPFQPGLAVETIVHAQLAKERQVALMSPQALAADFHGIERTLGALHAALVGLFSGDGYRRLAQLLHAEYGGFEDFKMVLGHHTHRVVEGVPGAAAERVLRRRMLRINFPLFEALLHNPDVPGAEAVDVCGVLQTVVETSFKIVQRVSRDLRLPPTANFDEQTALLRKHHSSVGSGIPFFPAPVIHRLYALLARRALSRGTPLDTVFPDGPDAKQRAQAVFRVLELLTAFRRNCSKQFFHTQSRQAPLHRVFLQTLGFDPILGHRLDLFLLQVIAARFDFLVEAPFFLALFNDAQGIVFLRHVLWILDENNADEDLQSTNLKLVTMHFLFFVDFAVLRAMLNTRAEYTQLLVLCPLLADYVWDVDGELCFEENGPGEEDFVPLYPDAFRHLPFENPFIPNYAVPRYQRLWVKNLRIVLTTYSSPDEAPLLMDGAVFKFPQLRQTIAHLATVVTPHITPTKQDVYVLMFLRFVWIRAQFVPTRKEEMEARKKGDAVLAEMLTKFFVCYAETSVFLHKNAPSVMQPLGGGVDGAFQQVRLLLLRRAKFDSVKRRAFVSGVDGTRDETAVFEVMLFETIFFLLRVFADRRFFVV